jgi:hypothetical protein
MDINILFWIIGTNILSQFLLYIFNMIKSNNDSPIVFKLLSYFTVFSVNIIFISFYLFNKNIFSDLILAIYLFLTFILFTIHFFFEEDWIFSFDKIVVFFFMTILVIIFYGVLFYVII